MLFLFIQIALSILRVLGLYVFLIYIFFLVCLRGFCSPPRPEAVSESQCDRGSLAQKLHCTTRVRQQPCSQGMNNATEGRRTHS